MVTLPIFQRTVTTDSGDVVPGAVITVKDEATGLDADLFEDRAGLIPLVQPFSTGNDGFVQFYVTPGEYRVEAQGGSGTITWRYQVLTGSAARREVGTEAGSVTEVGAFGLGGQLLTAETDLNAGVYRTNGAKIVTPAATTLTNTPAGADLGAAGRYVVETSGGGSGFVQTLYGTLDGTRWYRTAPNSSLIGSATWKIISNPQDFGLGNAVPLTSAGVDYNDFKEIGERKFIGAGAANAPTPTDSYLLEVIAGSVLTTTRAVQVAHSYTQATSYERFWEGVIWSPWRRIYTQANILGAVSQTTGVPTGAIIERGSNANGEYVKFADGTLICTLPRTSANAFVVNAALSSEAAVVWTFPHPFIDNQHQPLGIVDPATSPDIDGVVRYSAFSPNSVTVIARNGGSSAQDLAFGLQAVGRWYN